MSILQWNWSADQIVVVDCQVPSHFIKFMDEISVLDPTQLVYYYITGVPCHILIETGGRLNFIGWF